MKYEIYANPDCDLKSNITDSFWSGDSFEEAISQFKALELKGKYLILLKYKDASQGENL
jgi:hypothetical protein